MLIHVGTDSFGEGKRFATPQAFGEAVIHTFRNRYGIESAYFLRQGDGLATVMTYHIGDLIHGSNNGTEVKSVREALNAMPEAASMVLSFWEEELAAAQSIGTPSPTPEGG